MSTSNEEVTKDWKPIILLHGSRESVLCSFEVAPSNRSWCETTTRFYSLANADVQIAQRPTAQWGEHSWPPPKRQHANYDRVVFFFFFVFSKHPRFWSWEATGRVLLSRAVLLGLTLKRRNYQWLPVTEAVSAYVKAGKCFSEERACVDRVWAPSCERIKRQVEETQCVTRGGADNR